VIETTRLDAPLVVGAGVAGLTVALGLPRAYVVTVAEMGSTWWAQGGIAVALSPDDSPRQHADDTLSVSGGLGVEKVVDLLTGGGPGAVGNLIALGAEFDRDEKGELLLAVSSNNYTEAGACFYQALDLARRQSAKSMELRAAMSLCRLWQTQGKKEEARQMLAEVYGWFTEGFDARDLKEARLLLAELAGSKG